jgi:hypothetical protein
MQVFVLAKHFVLTRATQKEEEEDICRYVVFPVCYSKKKRKKISQCNRKDAYMPTFCTRIRRKDRDREKIITTEAGT